MFDHVTTGRDCEKGKPSPDLSLKSLEKWKNVHPSEVLIF
jgi:beta-phosphoglucomutase-like phosphatase (HAD superfamily)